LPGLPGAKDRPMSRFMPALIAACMLAPALAHAQGTATPGSRGALLYETHCISCHSTQMHWRDGRVATDWASLNRQVRRWQENASLNWSEDDILEVARHLNERFYRFEITGTRALSLLGTPPR
jgi:hypothetical protein